MSNFKIPRRLGVSLPTL